VDYLINLIVLIAAYTVPMYFANAMPVLFHGTKPLDFGRKFGGKRIFGKGKTVLGTLGGMLGGMAAGFVLLLSFPEILILIPNYFFLVITLAIGAILGDAIKSFFKRQLGIPSGQQWLLADQLDFVAGGFLLSLLVRVPEFEVVAILLLATGFIHLFTNFAAFKLKLKKVPW
jgi:CDP-2,3-bis-(O-geranylgeranyl)-sn-glycerol synthase